jgi:hypothetical protein
MGVSCGALNALLGLRLQGRWSRVTKRLLLIRRQGVSQASP